MNKQQLLSELISNLSIKSLKLPSNIEFILTNKTLKIIVDKGLTMNMQTNDSAFEGWGLCLKYNLPDLIDNVEIAWDIDKVDPKEDLHYKRFLYRVWKFTKTFSWAKCLVYDFSTYNTEGWIINHPKSEVTTSGANPEAKLERYYLESHAKDYDCICNQLPVGLFNRVISDLHRETPGQNSQIDLWAIQGDTLHIFELKVETNKSIGIITELMFYVNVMNDLINRTIEFDKQSAGVCFRHFDKLRTAITDGKLKKIAGHFLTNNLHPMITEKVIAGINSNFTNVSYSTTEIE